MKAFSLAVCFLILTVAGFTQSAKPGSRIIVNNELIHKLIPADAEIEVLGEGFEWTEGPLWLPSLNKLIFSDIPQNTVFEWTEEGGIKVYLKPSGYTGILERAGEPGSNGLLLSPRGKLVLCMHGDRRVAEMIPPVSQPAANFKTIAADYNGKRLNSPNDAVFNKKGELFFTDPPYGLELNVNDPAKELEFQGVFKTDDSGNMVLLTRELSRPNGIAFSPDESKLYIANSDPKKAIWMVYDVSDAGTIENGKIFFDATGMTKEMKGLPDGLKVHPNGWVFATGPGGVLVFTPEGQHLGTVFTGEATANCAFNNDFSALYITADNYLLRLKLKSSSQ
jgi:gluconolactonase